MEFLTTPPLNFRIDTAPNTCQRSSRPSVQIKRRPASFLLWFVVWISLNIPGLTQDTSAPVLLRAVNISQSTLRLEFDEAVSEASASLVSSFVLSGGASVSSASRAPKTNQIILETSGLTFGRSYVVTVSNIEDVGTPPNLSTKAQSVSFTAMELVPSTVGIANGQIERIGADAFDVQGLGTDIGGTSDRFQFASQMRSGNFDVQVRVLGIKPISSPFVQVGLMARPTTDINSAFAGVFSSSTQVGNYFESRATTGGTAAIQSINGGFPANYPWNYLRLRRVGNQFTGFASFDGSSWVQLGTAAITMPTNIEVGLATCSQNAQEPATAQFREYGATKSFTITTHKPDREPMGPSSRRTGLVFSEVLFQPKPVPGSTNSLEFIELHNTSPIFQDLTGWRITGGIDYDFPAKTRIAAGAFLVIAKDPIALTKHYNLSPDLVFGPFEGELNNGGDLLRLRDHVNAIRLEMSYSSDAPWPVSASGGGHSLVLKNPSYGEDDPRAWGASERIGGTPAQQETVLPNPYRGVLINEFLAHTDDPQLDFIEVFNSNNFLVDLSGCFLTDDPSTNRFRIPEGTILEPRSTKAWDQNQLGFRLNAAGESLYLIHPKGDQVIDALSFRAQENGIASGRSPDGSSTIRRLINPTPGAANSAWKVEDIVINEIMYHPISGDSDDEYVEIYNRGSTGVQLGGWRFGGGLDYKFPDGISLAPNTYLVISKNVSKLRSAHPHLNAGNSLGDFSGTLSDSSDRVALSKPIMLLTTNALGNILTNTAYAVVAETRYHGGGRWGQYSDGGGSSLELIDADADPLQAANWADSDETQKSAWQTVEFTGPLDNGNSAHPPNRFRISMLGQGECLLDDIEIFKVGSTNLLLNGGFENGQTGWSLNGNHSLSSVQSSGSFSGNNCLRVVGLGDGDTGVNAIRANIASGAAGLAANNTGTIRAKVRWLAGWPEVLLRTRGGWIELPARMNVPSNLGTPGLSNSRRIENAGPAIFDVSHSPALPRSNQPVVVSCRISDPDGFGALRLRFRVDPATGYSELPMRDDGSGGDAIGGDGIYSATIGGRGAGTLIAFVIQGTDGSSNSSTTTFPAPGNRLPVAFPVPECLIRWEDPSPTGSFGHYHIWNTQNTQTRRSNALDNTFRDCTLVYGNFRIIYNAGFRDKGSPFHGGGGDYAVTVPKDEILLGAIDRVFGSTGNGSSEDTGIRGRLAAWLGEKMDIPYLHAHYVRVFRNGAQHQNISEDLEQPNHRYAEAQFPGLGGEGDLHKIAIWFEFQDDNRTFDWTGATLQRFVSGGALKPGRYRWNFQRRPKDGTANNFTNVFELVGAANASSTEFINRMNQLADVEEWMRVFAFHRITGNWDSYNYNIGQNMYAYKVNGDRWKLLPWDIDFVFGLGDGATSPVGGGTLGGGSQDPVGAKFFNEHVYRRALWRALSDAVNGPLIPENFSPQIAERRNALLQNGITGLASTNAVYTYVNSRRNFIVTQLRNQDTNRIAITSNGGANFTSPTQTAVITGVAPFAAAEITVNGVPYPVTWTSTRNFTLNVPLLQTSTRLEVGGLDRRKSPLTNAPAIVTVTYNGDIQQPVQSVVINEIHYNPIEPNASFIELHNTSFTTPVDLSGYRLDGVGYTFPAGAILSRGGYMILASDKRGFAEAFGNTIPVFDVFSGNLDNGGENLRLLKPNPNGAASLVSDVRYDDQPPWPTQADGLGASLQLIDPQHVAFRVGNWMSTPTNDFSRVTPGRANAGLSGLPAFPNIWINEVLPNNTQGPVDNHGEREPFVELHNPGTDVVDLSELFLTDSWTQLNRWKFPSGTTVPPKGFLLVWLDSQPEQTTPSSLHANFRINSTNGPVAIVRLQGTANTPSVIDYVEYRGLPPGQSIGSFPDGEPRLRRAFAQITPGSSNNPLFPDVKLSINEWMTSNINSVPDPADGEFSDWFEIHNSGTSPVDLTSYRLTDSKLDPTRFIIPPGYVIQPGQFLLVWADGTPKQNDPLSPDLHTNFRLGSAGGLITILSPDGRVIDSIEYAAQTENVSEGRFPDSAPLPGISFEFPSPKAANFLGSGNRPPTLASINPLAGPELSPIRFEAKATDTDAGQTIRYSLGADAPAGAFIEPSTGRFEWTPNEQQGPGVFVFTVRATDNGTPTRSGAQSVRVTVTEANSVPEIFGATSFTVDEGSALSAIIQAKDNDLPKNKLRFELEAGAPSTMEIDQDTGELSWIPAEADGPGTIEVRIRVTDDATTSASATSLVSIRVNEVNNAPVFEPIQPQSVPEMRAWSFQVKAVDPDSPLSPVLYSLDGSPPPGLELNQTTGLFSWTPTEQQGPSSHVILVRATESGPSPLSSAVSFGILVQESNIAPTLNVIPDAIVEEGTAFTVNLKATDTDLPVQRLIYSLNAGGPPGAIVDPVTGVFEWQIPDDAGSQTNQFTVRVLDDVEGALSHTRSFVVTITPKFKIGFNEVLAQPKTPGGEFIEIINRSRTTAWDLSGAKIRGNSLNFTFPPNTVILPETITCLVANSQVFRDTYGPAPKILGQWVGSISPTNDDIALLAKDSERILDRVQFSNAIPWPELPSASGASIQVIDSAQERSRVANWANSSAYTGPTQPVVIDNLWRYYQSGPLPASWKSPEFDDSTWREGKALLYVESAALPAAKNTALTIGQNTYYFRTKFVLPTIPKGASIILSNIIDDGAVFYLNGTEVHRQGIDPGAVEFSSIGFDFANPRNAVDNGAWAGPFNIPSTALVAGTNVMAVEVHQVNATSSDVVFGASLHILGGTSDPATPGVPNSVAASLPAFPTVWINEVLPNNTQGLGDLNAEFEPWIEIVNTGNSTVNLVGLFLSPSFSRLAAWPFPNGSRIAAGQTLLVFADGEPAETTDQELHASFRLTSERTTLFLSRAQHGSMAVLDYIDLTGLAANESRASLPDGQPFTRAKSLLPSPGKANAIGLNQPPFIQPAILPSIAPGQQFLFQVLASDPDTTQFLTFSLEEMSQITARIDSATGLISWQPLDSDIGTYFFTVSVRDNGTPSLETRQTFQLQVIASNQPILTASLLRTGTILLQWTSVSGQPYVVQSKEKLSDPNWRNVADITAKSRITSHIDIPESSQSARFYRVITP